MKEQNKLINVSDALKFVDFVSDKSYKKCINGEWIQIGTGDYKTIAKNTTELYNLYKTHEIL